MDWGKRITENIDPFGDAGALELRPVKTARNLPNGQTEEGCQEREEIESRKQLWYQTITMEGVKREDEAGQVSMD